MLLLFFLFFTIYVQFKSLPNRPINKVSKAALKGQKGKVTTASNLTSSTLIVKLFKIAIVIKLKMYFFVYVQWPIIKTRQ